MSKQIALKPWMKTPEVIRVMQVLGSEYARFVGGCVRNTLLQKEPGDIDIATTHQPNMVMELLKAADIQAIPTGIEHGTVTAVIDRHRFEITTLRKDVACDGRHAEVEFTDDWERDARRRDFTMNGLFLDMEGNIYDYIGGIKDLEKGAVRFIGEPADRIAEDTLRILRFFRFQALYGRMEMEEKSLKACEKGAKKLSDLSGERIQAEMLKLLAAPDVMYVLLAMHTYGVLQHVIPGYVTSSELELMKRIAKAERKHPLLPSSPLTRLAGLLLESLQNASEGRMQEVVTQLAERWKLSNADRDKLMLYILPPIALIADIPVILQKKLIRKVGKEHFYALLVLAWAQDLLARPDGEKVIDAVYMDMITFAEKWKVPVFPVRGSDLIAMGVKQGKEVGELLKTGEKAWEENDYQTTRDELIKVMQNKARGDF